MIRLVLTFVCAFAVLSEAAAGTSGALRDSTLRTDWVLARAGGAPQVYLHSMSRYPVWAGRTHRPDSLFLAGNGTVTLRDTLTGRVLYTNSFSTLFSEWFTLPESEGQPRSFETTLLTPLPAVPAWLDVAVTSARRDTIASARMLYSPSDLLVADAIRPRLEQRTLHRGGDPARAIDVVILAEGYTDAEADSFFHHAAVAAREILGYAPFSDSADRFNFTALFTPSRDSGVSIPAEHRWADTAFGSHFHTFYSERYLTTPRVWRLHDAAQAVPYEHIIVLANTPHYGGGGIYNNYTLTAARHPDFRPVVVHEFGHSFGGLADEYFYDDDVMEDTYPTDVEPWERNITTLCDFTGKWENLLPEGTPVPTRPADMGRYPVGVYEGGGYSARGVYRPAFECRMRNNSYPVFCPGCVLALRRLIDFYTAP